MPVANTIPSSPGRCGAPGRSSLLHDGSRAAQLALDLLAGPAGRLDRPRLEFAVCARLLNERCDPVLPENLHQLAAGIGVRQIASVSR